MTIESTSAIIAGIFTLISAVFAYLAHMSSAKSQREVAFAQDAAQQAHERRRPFIEAQVRFYIEATETVAQIPSVADSESREKLVKRFWQLYWGPLALVEDNEVAQAMIDYGEVLKTEPDNELGLHWRSLRIAHACRSSLKLLWVPELGNITVERHS